MPLSFINTIDCLAFSLLLYLFFSLRDNRRRRGIPYPPGPLSLPIIGNILDVPKEESWITYADMSKKYGRGNFRVANPPLKLMVVFQGDVLCLHILGEVVVVLCSLSAIKDLLEKRAQVYSDRHQIPILEMCARYYNTPIIFRVDSM
jgi:hypothetical protein